MIRMNGSGTCPIQAAALALILVFAPAALLGENGEKAALPTGPPAEEPGFWSTLFSLQPVKEKDPAEKRWFFTMGGWYERKLGNTDSMRANGSADLEYKSGISELVLSYIQFYGEVKGERYESNGSGIAKFDHYLVSRLEFFIFNQSDFNEVIGLRIRNSSGTGLKLVFFRNRYWLADLSTAPVVEYQKYTAEDYTLDYRASFRARVKITVLRFLYLNCTVFFIPRFQDFAEYRYVVDADATLNVTPRAAETGGLLLKGGYRRYYNTDVPEGRKKLDEFYYMQVQVRI